jgi:hypothetical protein
LNFFSGFIKIQKNKMKISKNQIFLHIYLISAKTTRYTTHEAILQLFLFYHSIIDIYRPEREKFIFDIFSQI